VPEATFRFLDPDKGVPGLILYGIYSQVAVDAEIDPLSTDNPWQKGI
jgi:hypothetical protein